jgi:hypothetical protein
VGYATVGIEIRGIPPFAKSAKDGAPGKRRTLHIASIMVHRHVGEKKPHVPLSSDIESFR